ncbi:hypothetical protein [Lysinibacillus pakistanensis]|uniref:Uncharacterized protein n=1 Tax=Lysinibacillus pakistanensis TaxID=759811 RepID=A0AAX3X509_9BACI|nr:hypothetical protein [Lysinibacillus pakistanensis]WHY48818.1 hypothetical protein QNH22_11540 [Lysinibacillus pakistanensis]WHY53830.1 hypothetical protein QNH24_11520 [Lysinibacillus pakistanensis]
MSRMVKKSNGFPLRFKQYVNNSVATNTKNNINFRKKNEELNDFLKHHILNYSNVNQTIIGSYLFKLLHSSAFDTALYQNERINILKDIYNYTEKNSAWSDLWKTSKFIEEHVLKKHGVIDHQVSSEILDMIRLHMPYAKFIVGLENDYNPIIQTPPFYITEKLLNYIEYESSIGRKKGRELFTIQTQTVEFASYLVHSFGLYRDTHMDLLAQNGLTNQTVNSIKLPRQLAEFNMMIEFIENNRQYTMNPNGVVIDCYNCEDIDQVIIIEQNGYVLWKVIFKQKGIRLNQKGDLVQDGNGAEYCGYFSPSYFPRSTFSEHITHIDFELAIYDFVMECYADIICGTALINEYFKRDVVNVGSIAMQDDKITEINSKMGMRFIPRKVYQSVKEKTKTKIEYEQELKKYFIAGHIRKLPTGHSPSKEAVAHAQEFGIELPSNYTFVRPYETGEEKLRSHYTKIL